MLTERRTDSNQALLVAVVIGVLGLFVGINFDSVAAIGGPVGGWLIWRGVADSTPAHPMNRRKALAGFFVLVISGGLFDSGYVLVSSHILTFLDAVITVGGTVGHHSSANVWPDLLNDQSTVTG